MNSTDTRATTRDNVGRNAVFLCALRVLIKVVVGISIASPILIGDGVHNVSDAGIVGAAWLVLWYLKNKPDGMYAAENLIVLVQGAIAVIMVAAAVWVGIESTLGLFAPKVREYEVSSLGIIVLVIAISVSLSLFTGEYLIRSGRDAFVSAGKEIRGDAWIECSILIGFAGEYFWAAPRIQYVAGIAVAILVLVSAREMLTEAKNIILQIRISKDFEEGILALVLSTYGTGSISKLETYHVPDGIRVKLFLLTQGGAEANEDIRHAVKERIRLYAHSRGHDHCRCDVEFALPKEDWHRNVCAIMKGDPAATIAPSIARANALRICDVEYGEVVSVEDVLLPQSTTSLIALLKDKHVRTYRAWNESPEFIEALTRANILYEPATTIVPPFP